MSIASPDQLRPCGYPVQESALLTKVDTKEKLADPFAKMFAGEEHARLGESCRFEQQMLVLAG